MDVSRLERREIFRFLRPDQIRILSDHAELVRFKAGDTVYERGAKADSFYLVLSGEVALRLPGKEKFHIHIDTLSEGAMFGSCVSSAIAHYVLTARCIEDSEILKFRAAALKKLMDEEPHMGYAIQSRISQIYFQRYIETMKKLQAIVMNIPIE